MLEVTVGEVPENRLLGRLPHGQIMMRAAPARNLLGMAGRAMRRADMAWTDVRPDLCRRGEDQSNEESKHGLVPYAEWLDWSAELYSKR